MYLQNFFDTNKTTIFLNLKKVLQFEFINVDYISKVDRF